MPLTYFQKIGLFFFFSLYLIIGLFIFEDYGVHVDEGANIRLGGQWGSYIQKVLLVKRVIPVQQAIPSDEITVNQRLSRFPIPQSLSHGPFWDLVLFGIEKRIYGDGSDPRGVILLRHLLNFLLFYVSAIFFCHLLLRIFKNYPLAFCGVLLYILHPRIFADSFYNTVDVAFLSFWTIATCTLWNLLKKKDVFSAVVHGVVCAWMVDVRVAGLMLPFFTALCFLIDLFHEKQNDARSHLIMVAGTYLGVFTAGMLLFWPLLWTNPFYYFSQALQGGIFNNNIHPPPEYNFFWIVMTTPPVYLLLFAIGLFRVRWISLENRFKDPDKYRMYVIAVFLFVTSLVLPVFLKTLLYDSWRHHYFVYSPFVLICLFGIEPWFKNRKTAVITVVILLLTFLNSASFLIQAHPFQFVYGNILAQRNSRVFYDYWALSGRQALEYILANDSSKASIRVGFPKWGSTNIYILPGGDRKRLTTSRKWENCDYVVIMRARYKEAVEKKYDLIHMITVKGMPITYIYKKR